MDISPPIQSGSNGPIAKECHRFLVAGPFKLARSLWPLVVGKPGSKIVVETRNGVPGKVCSTCGKWKSLDDFPTDPRHPPSQGGRHCRCKECHRIAAAKRRALSRKVTLTLAVLALCASINSAAFCREKHVYLTGKLLDLTVQDVSRGTAIIGGMAAPVPGKLYVFQIQSDDLVYFADYRAGKLSYKPEWVVNDPIEFRLGRENRMFLKRPDGKELEVAVIKKVRRPE